MGVGRSTGERDDETNPIPHNPQGINGLRRVRSANPVFEIRRLPTKACDFFGTHPLSAAGRDDYSERGGNPATK